MPNFDEFLKKGLAYHGFSKARKDRLKLNPVKRITYTDPDPAFSWIIDNTIRKKLSDYPQSPVFSSCFYFHGYPMALKLKASPDSDQHCGFYLTILGMEDDDFLNVFWEAKSDIFNLSGERMYTGEICSWGSRSGISNAKLFEVPEDVSHKIEVWMKFI